MVLAEKIDRVREEETLPYTSGQGRKDISTRELLASFVLHFDRLIEGKEQVLHQRIARRNRR